MAREKLEEYEWRFYFLEHINKVYKFVYMSNPWPWKGKLVDVTKWSTHASGMYLLLQISTKDCLL